eukprot:CAMPEP_0202731476 /NCGR_PEP_ID=MMETSP1385-20130828/187173_1 /ASSEMBLY_ACC=CAM_ASM_000861 /TAXON_ID=933848 /ORGANISM="Elphidium margaritaceum" /LENGTH=254 /DNA_ID=CAMNT_0049397777 /DNA_START=31 /DNA_END=796 /DNA_ORIENTATION=-
MRPTTATADPTTVTIRTDSLSSDQILVAVAAAFNLSSTPLTVTILSSSDGDDGVSTVEFLVAVPSGVRLEYDVLKATLREAMVDEYGDDIKVDIDVDGDHGEEDELRLRLPWQYFAVAVGSFIAGAGSVAACWICFLRKQRSDRLLTAHLTSVVNGAADTAASGDVGPKADDVSERKQGEEDAQLQEEEEEKEDVQASAMVELVAANSEALHVAGQEDLKNTRNTTADSVETRGATAGNDADLGVYELNFMVDL